MRIRLLAFAFLVPLVGLAGCSLGGTIAEHSIAYNGTMQAATDTLLVTNILRARDGAPLHFSTIGAIHGSFNLSAGLGYDLSQSAGATQPALLAASNPSFDIGPLDRQEFARGLLRPIDPVLLRLLSDRGLPDQLLLYLLVSKFDEGPGGRFVVNDPRARHPLDEAARRACAEAGAAARPPCDPFQSVVDNLTRFGPLRFNGYTRLIPLGPPLSRAEASAPERLAMLKETGVSLRRLGNGWQLYRAVNQLVICVPGRPGSAPPFTALALDNEPPQVSPMTQEGDPCNADEVADRPIPAGHAAAKGLAWYLRSVDELLHYLGAVQRREEEGAEYRVSVPLGAGRQGRPRLFRLWQAQPARPHIAVDYAGQRWFVAAQDDAEDQTLRVLALTTQLLNLQKSAGEIPSSGTLRLVR
ncbi:hypothetical protein JMJ55_15925 [Belnapia sp. T6]|uniref:Uncharacterized protein n=1 Tax=Belnapia mucosa TaxID=2804532 RepID=A0ABS1V581_9PROT|nr:hypothetical protein [Belnapia mucosa]MBL6456826.1 hypothetical protein [Belnapia mucosa]